MTHLSKAQRRHLLELAAIYDAKGHAFWTPIGSAEERCAAILDRRGFLVGHHMTHSKTQYELTPDGRAAVGVSGEPTPE